MDFLKKARRERDSGRGLLSGNRALDERRPRAGQAQGAEVVQVLWIEVEKWENDGPNPLREALIKSPSIPSVAKATLTSLRLRRD